MYSAKERFAVSTLHYVVLINVHEDSCYCGCAEILRQATGVLR